MKKPSITQDEVNSVLRDRIGSLMLLLWQQEAYIKALDAFVEKFDTPEPPDNKEVLS